MVDAIQPRFSHRHLNPLIRMGHNSINQIIGAHRRATLTRPQRRPINRNNRAISLNGRLLLNNPRTQTRVKIRQRTTPNITRTHRRFRQRLTNTNQGHQEGTNNIRIPNIRRLEISQLRQRVAHHQATARVLSPQVTTVINTQLRLGANQIDRIRHRVPAIRTFILRYISSGPPRKVITRTTRPHSVRARPQRTGNSVTINTNGTFIGITGHDRVTVLLNGGRNRNFTGQGSVSLERTHSPNIVSQNQQKSPHIHKSITPNRHPTANAPPRTSHHIPYTTTVIPANTNRQHSTK